MVCCAVRVGAGERIDLTVTEHGRATASGTTELTRLMQPSANAEYTGLRYSTCVLQPRNN